MPGRVESIARDGNIAATCNPKEAFRRYSVTGPITNIEKRFSLLLGCPLLFQGECYGWPERRPVGERQSPGKNQDVATAASPENTVQAKGT